MKLFEILVPTVRNDGRPFKLRYHRVWDKKVQDITGGMTIMPKTVRGTWMNKSGDLFCESMIPVRIMCTQEQMDVIVDMTIEYYNQEAVLYYVISNEVFIKSRTLPTNIPSKTNAKEQND